MGALVGLTYSAHSMGSSQEICICTYCGCLIALTDTNSPHVEKVKYYHWITSWKPGQIFHLLSNLIIQFCTAFMGNFPQENHFSSIANTWLQGYILYSKRISPADASSSLLNQQILIFPMLITVCFTSSCILLGVIMYCTLFFFLPAVFQFPKRDYQVLKSIV